MLKHNRYVAKIILLIVSVCLFAPMAYYKGIQVGELSDFDGHNRIVENILDHHVINTPHFLFHILSAVTSIVLFNENVTWSSIAVNCFSYFLLSIVIYKIICNQLCYRSESVNCLVIIFLTFAIIISSPISLMAILDNHLYYQYIPMSTFHNPTITLLRPFAIINFFIITQIFIENNIKHNNVIVIALTTMLAVLAKPNYIICALPAFMMVYLYKFSKSRDIKHYQFFAGFVIPACIILYWQYYMTYTNSQVASSKASIIIAPFAIFGGFSIILLVKFLLSVAFPLSICVVYWREAKQDIYLKYAWLLFAIGSIQTYFLAESGSRLLHGNFGWSGQITLFILFFVSAIFLFRQYAGYLSKGCDNAVCISKGAIICSSLFALHVLAGIVWYGCNLVGPRTLW